MIINLRRHRSRTRSSISSSSTRRVGNSQQVSINIDYDLTIYLPTYLSIYPHQSTYLSIICNCIQLYLFSYYLLLWISSFYNPHYIDRHHHHHHHLYSRVIVTTHYQRIKELAVQNDNFRIAAMEFIDNKPTYRLKGKRSTYKWR